MRLDFVQLGLYSAEFQTQPSAPKTELIRNSDIYKTQLIRNSDIYNDKALVRDEISLSKS